MYTGSYRSARRWEDVYAQPAKPASTDTKLSEAITKINNEVAALEADIAEKKRQLVLLKQIRGF